MEEKLREILSSYDERIGRYELQEQELSSKLSFYKAHNFEEEYRVANIEYQAITSLVYKWRNMHKDISEVLLALNS